MNSKLALTACIFSLFFVFGCAKKSVAPIQMSAYLASPKVLAEAPQRYIAESHKLDVITTESQLEKSWQSVVAYCGTLQCEVMSSSITTKTNESEPTGDVAMRVAPGDLSKLLDEIGKLGKIAVHTTQREDKTADVVDTDAKIKNLTAFRDNLRAMLAKPSATVKDLVEIQQQLTDTQAQLDSETAMRKVLANETEKVAVEVTFRIQSSAGNASGWAEIWGALQESGSDLADSTASLITVIVTIIPWLIIILPGIWILVKLWRRMRRKRSGAPPPTTVI